VRKNSYKGHKTPWDIIRERTQDIKPNVVALPPVFLDELFIKKLDQKSKGGVRCYSLSLSFPFVLAIDGCRVYAYPKKEGRFIRH